MEKIAVPTYHMMDRLASWIQVCQLKLAAAICKHLCITRSSSSNNYFYAGSENINEVSVVRDLTIFVCDNLKWSHHLNFIQCKASLCTFQMLRSFSTKNVWILLPVLILYLNQNIRCSFSYT